MFYFVSILMVFGITSTNVILKRFVDLNTKRPLASSQLADYLTLENLAHVGLIGLLMMMNLACYIFLLSKFPLHKTFAMLSIVFIMVPIASFLIFEEQINNFFVFGMILISIGVVLTRI